AVLLLFAVVRKNLASADTFRRLAVVLVLNGVALSLFGVVQNLTSRPQRLYWTYPTLGQVFGPCVSRNLFPYYVIVCVGLRLGLFLARRSGQGDLTALGGRG